MGFKPHQLVSAERKKSSAPLGSPVRRKLHSREPKRCLPRVRSLNPGSSRIKLLPIQRPFSSINFLGSVLVISYTSGDSRQFRTFKRELELLALLHLCIYLFFDIFSKSCTVFHLLAFSSSFLVFQFQSFQTFYFFGAYNLKGFKLFNDQANLNWSKSAINTCLSLAYACWKIAARPNSKGFKIVGEVGPFVSAVLLPTIIMMIIMWWREMHDSWLLPSSLAALLIFSFEIEKP